MPTYPLVASPYVLWFVLAAAVSVAAPAAQALENHPSTEAESYPEAVLIEARSSSKSVTSRSSGVLLDQRVVLTVAHGVAGFDRWEVTVPHAKGGATTVPVQTVRLHPDYEERSFENDLAILLLAEPIEIDRTFPELHRGDLCRIGTPLILVGRVDNGTPSNEKLFVAETERTYVRGNINIYGGLPHTSQRGDSGGPVFLGRRSHEVVALIGGGVGASAANVPTDIYVPITDRNRGWILAQFPRTARRSGEPISAR